MTEAAARATPSVALVRAMRPHQWVKNLLVFVPILLDHRLTQPEVVARGAIAFAAFCLAASGAYVLNDILDLEADRSHPTKRHRPFASGALSPRAGYMLAPALIGTSLVVGAALVAPGFLALLLLYIGLTTAYSAYLKRVVVLDVLLLAGLYTLRVLAGITASGVRFSTWLLAFSTFLFLSLAFLKRHGELSTLAAHPAPVPAAPRLPAPGHGVAAHHGRRERLPRGAGARALSQQRRGGASSTASRPCSSWYVHSCSTGPAGCGCSRIAGRSTRTRSSPPPAIPPATSSASWCFSCCTRRSEVTPITIRPGRSWGRYPAARHSRVLRARWRDQPPALGDVPEPLLPSGCGRSYGDSGLNADGALIDATGLDRFIELGDDGLLRCEAGVTLAEILDLVVPRGWCLPVVPGTRWVTVGGAIANDIHGKNHHRAGDLRGPRDPARAGALLGRADGLLGGGRTRSCSRRRSAVWG